MKNWVICSERLRWILVFFVATLIYFPSISRPIRDAESKYIEIPREIIVTGDWITPHLDFVKYYTKPPLTFWVVAIGYKLFGIHIWVARAINILWAFLAAFLIGFISEQMFGKGVGYIGSAIFLLTSEVFAYALYAGIEFALISCITASLLFFWMFWTNRERRYIMYFYACMGVGYLVKGFLGFAIPCAVVLVFLFINRQLYLIKEILDPVGIILFLLEVLPWTILMSIRNPDFIKYFIINEHIGRIIGRRDTSEALFPTSLFLEHMAGEFFPWILYIPIILKSAFDGIKKRGISRQINTFLLVWFAVPFILFSISRDKVDFYGMHVYPPLIIILSNEIRSCFIKRYNSINLWAYPWLLVAVISIFSLAVLMFKESSNFIKFLDIPSILIARYFVLASFIFGIVIWLLFLRNSIIKAFFLIIIYMCIFFVCTKKMYLADFKKDSMKFAVDIYNQMGLYDAPIFCADLPEFAHVAIINFYLNKPVYILTKRGEDLPGFKDREKMYIDERNFLKIVKRKKKVFLIGKTNELKKRLNNINLKYILLGSSDGRSIFLVLPKHSSFY